MRRTQSHCYNNTFLHILILITISFTLRLYSFRIGTVMVSSDEIFLFEHALKPVYALFHPSIEIIATELFRFFNFGRGWGNLFFGTIFYYFYALLGISFTEFTIHLPYIFVGTGSVLMAYILGKEIYNKTYGFIVAFLLAILPSHVAFSRSIGLNGISGLFYFFMTIYFFIRFFKTKKQFYKLLGYSSIAYYLMTDNQAVAIIPLLLFCSYIYSSETKQQGLVKRIYYSLRQVFSLYGFVLFIFILTPTVLGAIYLYTKGLFLHSYLNIFHSKPIVIGFYVKHLFTSFVENIGLLFTFVILFGFLLYIILVMLKQIKRESFIFFGWFILYTTPWLFLVVPASYELRVYNTYSITALIFMTGYVFLFFIEWIQSFQTKKRSIAVFFYFLLTISSFLFLFHTIVIISSVVYHQDFFEINMPAPVFGRAEENTGIKTLGYYVREHTAENSTIFVDVESFVGQYYFNRTIIGDLDLTSEQIYEQLLAELSITETSKENNELVNKLPFEYAFVTSSHFALLGHVLEHNGYEVIATAVNSDGKILARLYSFINNGEITQMDGSTTLLLPTEKYDKLFNLVYGNLESVYIDYG